MTNFAENIWKSIVIHENDNSNDVIINNEKKSLFIKYCKDYRKMVLTNYMDEDTKELDRHKIAAIIVVSLIKSGAIQQAKDIIISEDEIFVGDKMLAMDMALAYMLSDLNQHIEAKGITPLNHYFFPNSFSCEYNFYDVMVRKIFYNEENNILDKIILDLADLFFLIEYITLLKSDIDTTLFEK